MYAWETRLTSEDANRVVRPLEWGFEFLADWSERARELAAVESALTTADAEREMLGLNAGIVARSEEFFSAPTPTDFVLEERVPEIFSTNVRPATLKKEAEWQRRVAAGEIAPAKFLRFTSRAKTGIAENDRANARWYEAPAHTEPGRPKQAMIVMPQWNADAMSHNILCEVFARFGVSSLRLSKPFHDIRRPADTARSDYAVSANIGRTIASARQAVLDIRGCLDWLEAQGYEDFGILGTSLGSCYAYLASAHDPRIKVNVYNHASTWFGDVVWEGQSTRHIREGLEQAGFGGDDGQRRLRELWAAVSPPEYEARYGRLDKRVRMIYAKYDLTFPLRLSREAMQGFVRQGVDFEAKELPCGHYTTGETPFKYLDGWWICSYVHKAFKRLRRERELATDTRVK
jgi:hypothetical protein